MEDHGFWIPLTVLFVLRPAAGRDLSAAWSCGRSAPRPGWSLASLLSEWLQGDAIALALVLTVATGFAYGLLTVQYALFTAAITIYAVVLADTLGEPDARGGRPAGRGDGDRHRDRLLAFLIWSNPEERRTSRKRSKPANR